MPMPANPNEHDDLLSAYRRVLQELARGAPLAAVLKRLTEEGEASVPGMRCSVLLLREGNLYEGAAPSMPEFFRAAVEGLPIGPQIGSCGAAAHSGRRVVARDVEVHPNWADFLDLARAAQIRSSWSEPIKATDGSILGTFAMYYGEPREPDAFELEAIGTFAQIAAIAIESDLTSARRRETEQRFRQLAEAIREVFWLTERRGANDTLLYVSPAIETVFGCPRENLCVDPHAWSKDIHPADRAAVLAQLGAARTQGECDLEYRLLRPDGSVRWIHDRMFRVASESGSPERFAGISEDVSARRQTTLALAHALEELEARARLRENSLQAELLLAEERERRRLAIDLHDGLNQQLTLAQMKLVALAEAVDARHEPAARKVLQLIADADRAARNLTFQLSPPVLHDLGFSAAVQWLAEEIQQSFGLQVEFEDRLIDAELDRNISLLLFRAVRELLTNVAKHAKASRANVSLRQHGAQVEVVVRDNGVAFNPSAVSGRGLGLSSIRERLELLGGRMQIDSSSGQGTAVTLLAPRKLGHAPEPAPQ
ncbi:MAG: PAS domain S-box protein [Planctomycetes bacterium]|nr:PAS domain S-box protein [Planctomycetota bacterium]